MSDLIDLAGLDRAAVLAALYNGARPQGMGMLHYDPAPMSVEDAALLLAATPDGYFDYVKGRVMKVRLRDEILDPWHYDRDNGAGAAASIIDGLRS